MHYDILGTGRGVVTTLSPKFFSDMVHFAFGKETEGYTACFDCKGHPSLYREIKHGECEIPADKLEGNVHVTLLHDGQRIECDDVTVKHRDDCTVVAPFYGEIVAHVVKQDQEISRLTQMVGDLNNMLKSLEYRMQSYYEGLDII